MRSALILPIVATLLACTPQSPRGFRLPEGNEEAGRVAYQALGCHACHRLNDEEKAQDADDRIVLGGNVPGIETYGKLVASIINPSHRMSPRAPQAERLADGRSPMEAAKLNDAMTVTQLVDLVTMLQPMYRVVPPQGSPYAYYPPGGN